MMTKQKPYKFGWPKIGGMCGNRLKCIVTGSPIAPTMFGDRSRPMSLMAHVPCLFTTNGEIVGPVCEHIGNLAEKSPEKIAINPEYLEHFRMTQPELAVKKWADMFVE